MATEPITSDGDAVLRHTYLRVEGMTWPNPDDPAFIEWLLCHGDPPTQETRNVAASFVAAYKQLINDPVKVRNAKVAMIRRAVRDARQEGTDGN